MTDRRDYGTGSVFQKHDHKTCPEPFEVPSDTGAKSKKVWPEHDCKGTWVGKVENGYTPRGTRRRIEVTGKTRPIVLRKMNDRKKAVARHGTNAVATITVKTWADRYLEMAVNDLAPKAFGTSRSNVTKWIVPTIGNRQLDKLTRADLRRVQDAQAKAGNKPSSIRRTHSVAIAMLKAAVADELFVPQSVLTMPAPEINETTRTSMTVPQVVKMLEQIASAPDPSRWMGVLFQALRPGEWLGLERSSLDFENNVMAIGWQLQALPYIDVREKELGFRVPRGYAHRHLTGAWHLVRPKTKAGIRFTPMTPWFRAAVETWLETAPANEYGLVWATKDGRPINPEDALAEWRAMQVAAGIIHPESHDKTYVLHEGRHTTATLLREAGVDPDVIVDIIGHASYGSTKTYVHNTLSEQAQAAMLLLHERISAAASTPLALPA